MGIGEDGWRFSQVEGCVERASTYHLTEDQARQIIDHQIETIQRHWETVCDEAGLGVVARRQMWRTQVLNPFAFVDYRGRVPAGIVS